MKPAGKKHKAADFAALQLDSQEFKADAADSKQDNAVWRSRALLKHEASIATDKKPFVKQEVRAAQPSDIAKVP